MHFLHVQAGAALGSLAIYAAWLVCSLSCLGVALETRPQGVYVETLRWIVTGIGVAVTGGWFMAGELPAPLVTLILVWCLVSVVWLWVVKGSDRFPL
jgi:hypothetical protein